MGDDPRVAAARYRSTRESAQGRAPHDAETPVPERGSTASERAAYVETAIQQAIRRGEFDDLPGAGKPIEGLGGAHDPDWWIRRKIHTENLTGLGPPALMLRVEAAELGDRLDALTREGDVREALVDFNRRVVEARRQLQGGPPVVTPTRDVEAEIAAWSERREQRVADEAADSSDIPRRTRWWARTRH